MSAQQSTPTASPSAGQGDGNSGSDLSGDGAHQPADGTAIGEPSSPLGTSADIASLLANGEWGDTAHGLSADTNSYDGHVALALDTGVLPDIDSALDMLTSSHHLFDVPALDVSSHLDDSSST